MTTHLNSVYVPPLVHKNSRWLVVAEAPGEKEEIGLEPLIGPTGKLFDGFLASINLSRRDIDISNVLHYRPPNNELMPWVKANHPYIGEGLKELKELLDSHNYEAILALGWFSLWALAGKRGITEHRGSVYYTHSNGRYIPVIGTYHPAKLFRDPKDANVIFRDFAKFRRIIREGPPKPPDRRLLLGPSIGDLELWCRSARDAPWLACDIEADIKSRELTEVGFATSGTNAVSIRVTQETLPYIIELLSLPNDKVFHNAAFDVPFLEYVHGIKTCGKINDTMLMHHTLYPELPKDLGFCVSIYTDEPYFKALGKKRGNEHGTIEEFLRYNALDTATTAEIYPLLLDKLASVGLSDVYERDREMLPISFRMSMRGVGYDRDEAGRLKQRLQRDWKRWQFILNRLGGVDKEKCKEIYSQWDALLKKKQPNVGINAGSSKQIPKVMKELGLPTLTKKDKKTDEEKATTSQLKLLNLYPRLKDRRARRFVRALLMVRQCRKLLSSYLKTKVGRDGRMRTSFGVAVTETGRWNASAFLIGLEGTNMQTVPPQWKSCFIASPGKLLFYADYSQIEARLVGFDAGDEKQIAVFSDPDGDIHRENAARILGKEPQAVTDRERQVVGKTVHALNYDVGPRTLAESINRRGLETGIFVTESFTRGIKDKYLDLYKDVVRWQNRQWRTVQQTRILTNHLGRRRIFLGPTKGVFAHTTRGECIAFVPQSDVPDMLNIAMQRLDQEVWCSLLLQVHDAVVGEMPDDGNVLQYVDRIKTLMRVPLTVGGRTCIVPVDIKIGKRWSALKKPEKWVS